MAILTGLTLINVMDTLPKEELKAFIQEHEQQVFEVLSGLWPSRGPHDLQLVDNMFGGWVRKKIDPEIKQMFLDIMMRKPSMGSMLPAEEILTALTRDD